MVSATPSRLGPCCLLNGIDEASKLLQKDWVQEGAPKEWDYIG